MKAIEFTEVNVRIAEKQPEYQTVPSCVIPNVEGSGFNQVTACFQLDDQERKQVAETGILWYTVMQPTKDYFHPIMMDVTKPDLK